MAHLNGATKIITAFLIAVFEQILAYFDQRCLPLLEHFVNQSTAIESDGTSYLVEFEQMWTRPTQRSPALSKSVARRVGF